MRTNYPCHLPAFDYIGPHRYFLTFCCLDRHHAFTTAEPVDLVMSQFLRAAADENMAIIAACFMPEHVHIVVEGTREDSDLKRFIARAKQLSAFHYRQRFKKTLRQRYGYEHVLREEESTRQVVAYVLENPVRAGLVKTVYDYPFIRSSEYTREMLIDYVYRRWSG